MKSKNREKESLKKHESNQLEEKPLKTATTK